MMNFMETRIAPWAHRIGSNKFLSSISNGFNMILPIILVGAMFSLLTGINFAPYQEFLSATQLKPLFDLIPKVTTNMLAVYATFAIAFQYAIKRIGNDDAPVVGVLALFLFFIVTPLTQTDLTSTLTGDENIAVFTLDWFGGTGLFSAILISVITVETYRLIVTKGWVITLPDGVPPTVSKSFSALIPTVIIVLLGLTFNYVLAMTPFENFHQIIYGLVLLPLSGLTDNLFTTIILLLLMHFFWFFGMHGTLILGPVLLTILMPPTIQNMEALAANQPIPNIFSLGFISVIALGGIGSTLPLLVVSLRAKSQRFKTLTRLAFVPSVFGINEPVIFGYPIVLNPKLFIPFMAAPIVNALILYFAIQLNIVSPPALMQLPTGTPIFVDGFLQMGINGVFIQAAMFAVDMLLYYPFARYADKVETELETQS